MKLQEKRLKRGLSQSMLARASSVSKRAIQKYECGERDINKAQAGIVYKLSKALKCRMEDLLNKDTLA